MKSPLQSSEFLPMMSSLRNLVLQREDREREKKERERGGKKKISD
jgi:hypothetical protein